MNNKEIFRRYLQDISKISHTTIKRYINAIDTISKDIEVATTDSINIYSLESVTNIEKVIELFKTNLVLKEKNDKGQRFYTSALKKYKEYLLVDRIGEFLSWNDKNGSYMHKDRIKQEFTLLGYEEAIVLFYGVLNDDLYYNLADNIFELDYREVINIAKKNKVYIETERKLKKLFNCDEYNNEFFRALL